MAKKLRLRFKKSAKETGLRRVCAPERSIRVIIENNWVGIIDPNCGGYVLRTKRPRSISVEDPCPWGWFWHKETFASEEEAKEHIRANVNELWKLCYQKEY